MVIFLSEKRRVHDTFGTHWRMDQSLCRKPWSARGPRKEGLDNMGSSRKEMKTGGVGWEHRKTHVDGGGKLVASGNDEKQRQKQEKK